MPSRVPSSITAHTSGYIDRKSEIIVGLQTDAPLQRAIMPNGCLRMVLNSLKAYGVEPNPAVVETFSKCRKTHLPSLAEVTVLVFLRSLKTQA